MYWFSVILVIIHSSQSLVLKSVYYFEKKLLEKFLSYIYDIKTCLHTWRYYPIQNLTEISVIPGRRVKKNKFR